MFGLKSRTKKEKLLKNYKVLMQKAMVHSTYNESEGIRLKKQAALVLDQIEQLD